MSRFARLLPLLWALGSQAAWAAGAAAHAEGLAAGRAANPLARAAVSAPSASQVVPGYTTAPPELRLQRQPDLAGQGRQQLAQCAGRPNDPVCQAQRGAWQSALTPRPAVLPDDPSVAGARAVQRSPSQTLGSLSEFYSGCTTSTVVKPAGTTLRQCRRQAEDANLACRSTLAVGSWGEAVCTAGQWYAQAGLGSTEVAVQCLPERAVSQQHLRITHNARAVAEVDVDMTAPLQRPERLAVLEPTGTRPSLFATERRCSADTCELRAVVLPEALGQCDGVLGLDNICYPSGPVQGVCPAGTQSGDLIHRPGCEGEACTVFVFDASRCFSPTTDTLAAPGFDITGAVQGDYWVDAGGRNGEDWRQRPDLRSLPALQLRYPRADGPPVLTDRWSSSCDEALAGGRCRLAGDPVCVEGPGTRTIEGVAVQRDCWATSQPLRCEGSASDDACGALLRAGCTRTDVRCERSDPITGTCLSTLETHQCPVPAETVTTASNCPRDLFCLGEGCFAISAVNDPDFARSMSYLEASREAGVYLDETTLQVFQGEDNRCRDRLLKDCCDSDRAGAGMNNRSLFGGGSRLVFDMLMNAENRDFVRYGLSALLTGAGFNGAFTSYGVTVAVNGTALPAGSSVLFAGDSVVIAFDPWSLAIGAVLYVAMELASCNEAEGKLAMKEGARLCHTVGSWCSSCISILGACVSCIEHTTSKCCFNSVLARLINEQGRQQLGKTWGPTRQPDCSGFSVAELQRLDFAAMDLREFYASLVPTLPAAGPLQQGAAARLPTCYLGQGRCQ